MVKEIQRGEHKATTDPAVGVRGNRADHRNIHGELGAGRELVVKVKAVRRRPEVRDAAAGAHPHILPRSASDRAAGPGRLEFTTVVSGYRPRMEPLRGMPAPITPPDSPGDPPPEELPVGPEPGIVPDYPPPEQEPQPAVIPDQPHEPLPAEDPPPVEPDPEPVQPPGEDPVPV